MADTQKATEKIARSIQQRHTAKLPKNRFKNNKDAHKIIGLALAHGKQKTKENGQQFRPQTKWVYFVFDVFGRATWNTWEIDYDTSNPSLSTVCVCAAVCLFRWEKSKMSISYREHFASIRTKNNVTNTERSK